MPILTSVANVLTKPMPKLLSAKGHAIADYVTAGTFLALGGLFWRRNKRAAVASMVCGASEVAVSLLTDYPGGITDLISFPLHCKIDLGLAAMTASVPEFFAFDDDREKRFFLVQAGLIVANANLTQRDRRGRSRFERRPYRAA